ncbi:MAG: CBS domain-containing protein [Dethiobacter sp.]|jgi:CBS domain-containing protein|nr:CBS domain-containing protein [Dethiobacter sp.]
MKLIFHNNELIATETFLAEVPPFNLLDKKTIASIIDRIEVREFLKGSYVFRQGDSSLQSLFIVVSGTAEVTVLNDQDQEAVTGLRTELMFFGETGFFFDEPYPASVRAATNLTCLVIPYEVFENTLSQIPEFSIQLNLLLAERMRTVYLAMTKDTAGLQNSMEQPMRKRVADLMSTPAATCFAAEEISVLAAKMTDLNVSSLVVVSQDNNPLGIVTEKDLVSKVLARGEFVKRLTATDVMSGSLLTVAPEAFYYEALLTMVKNKVKHLVVTSGNKLVGIVTLRDLIISRSSGALTIVNSIENQNNIEGLAKASREIDKVLQALVSEKASSQEILQIITEFFDRLTRKVIQVCEREMINEGYGPPPVSYSWITMGSSGRLEQFVKTDQDNGIIYENVLPEKEEETKHYFHILAEKVVEGLFRCGFAKCKGNVMASNPSWCRSFREWREVIFDWIDKLDSENVRLLTIFLDFRHIYGKKSLCDLLRNFVNRRFQKASTVLLFLARDDLGHRVPLNFFKQIITEKSKEHRNKVNLKGAACVHMVDCLRIFSLREGIVHTNTFERLDDLFKRGVFSKDDTEAFHAAYESLMMFRIRESLKQLSHGQQPDNYITPDELSKKDKAILRGAFLAVDKLQNLTGHAFYAFIG